MGILDEKYVLLTTFRKNGDGVPTPVWIVRIADGVGGFTTEDSSGKVKRIRNNPRVTLQPCNMRGKVGPDAPVLEATAEVMIGADAHPVAAAVRRKYWIVATLMQVPGLWRKVRRRPDPVECAIKLTLDDHHP